MNKSGMHVCLSACNLANNPLPVNRNLILTKSENLMTHYQLYSYLFDDPDLIEYIFNINKRKREEKNIYF